MASTPTMSPGVESEGVEMKPKAAATYLSLLVPSILGFALLWSWLAPNHFYHCADPIPIQSFIPPFLHEHGGKYMDQFIVSDLTVYFTWIGFVIASLALPLAGSYFIVRAFRYNRWREVRKVAASRPPTMRVQRW